MGLKNTALWNKLSYSNTVALGEEPFMHIDTHTLMDSSVIRIL